MQRSVLRRLYRDRDRESTRQGDTIACKLLYTTPRKLMVTGESGTTDYVTDSVTREYAAPYSRGK